MPEYSLKPLPEDGGKRLDLVLFEYFRQRNIGFSRTFIQGLIAEKKVTAKGMASLKPNYKVKPQDEFSIKAEQRQPQGLSRQNIPLDVVYDNSDLAVINKPQGLVVHPAPGNPEHTLVNALLYRFRKLSDISPQRPGIVHRLDKGTSGLIVIAKNNSSHLNLAKQFASHTIKRKYVALVKGRVEFNENVIELPITRHPTKRKNMSVGFDDKAKYAKTFYRCLRRNQDASLLELEPYTGRTHQIRVHLAFIGHPIMGDSKYGRNNQFSRLALHAKYLGFTHPCSGKFMEFETETPKEFLQPFK